MPARPNHQLPRWDAPGFLTGVHKDIHPQHEPFVPTCRTDCTQYILSLCLPEFEGYDGSKRIEMAEEIADIVFVEGRDVLPGIATVLNLQLENYSNNPVVQQPDTAQVRLYEGGVYVDA